MRVQRLILIAVLLVAIMDVVKAQKKNINTRLPMISTHRGASYLAPENTLAAFSKAIELGADFIEIDVRTTADGAQVIMHDRSLKRTTGLDADIEKTTLPEIRKLSAGAWFSEYYKDQKVPTLAEVCELVESQNRLRKNPVKLYVDCKAINTSEVIKALNNHALMDSAVFYSDISTLTEIKKLYPMARVMPAYPGRKEMKHIISNIAPYAVDVAYEELDAEIVSFCHAKRIKVFSDLLAKHDYPQAYRKAIQLKIDLIQTDNISSVLEVYKEYVESK